MLRGMVGTMWACPFVVVRAIACSSARQKMNETRVGSRCVGSRRRQGTKQLYALFKITGRLNQGSQ